VDLFQLALALVNIPSVTGQEMACTDFLGDYLERQGFAVELQPVSDGRANLLAFAGRPEVVLSSHLDTVPPFIPGHEDSEFIYGRGACDAKGIIAAQVMAAERLRSEGCHNFGLLYVVGEETVSDGARAANESPRGSRFLINGEPTENKLAIATKGYLALRLRARGRMAHSAYPHLGENAIEKLLDVLGDLRKLPLPTHPLLGPTTMNIGLIAGGRAANVIPDEAEATVVFRTSTEPAGTAALRSRIEALLQGRCEWEFFRDTPALRLEVLEGFEAEVFAFTTDLPSLTRWGRPLLLGPGSVTVAHTEQERVRKADLLRAVELYCCLVKQLKER
jgi:acetylornithine deacetylase